MSVYIIKPPGDSGRHYILMLCCLFLGFYLFLGF